jgi:hypothetical protein
MTRKLSQVEEKKRRKRGTGNKQFQDISFLNNIIATFIHF